MKILVSTDSSCLIDYELLKKLGISVFPLNVIVDGEEYLDGITINQETLCSAMRDNKAIKTSTPAYGTILEYFDNLFSQGYDHIVHFTISSKLSSMYSLFKTISEEEYKDKLTIIDSYSVSALMLSHVLYMYDEINKGTNIEEILKEIEQRKKDYYIYFVPENLNALKNGGRISPTIAAIANTVGIKPLIVLEDGGLEKSKMIKNTKHALCDRFDEIVKEAPGELYDYTLVIFDCKETTYDYIYEYMSNTLGDGKVLTGIIPVNVCAHCGPGTIGLIVSKKINKKSIKDFM